MNKMRFGMLCLFMLLIGVFPDSAQSASATFDTFMESRQVIATVYFSYGSSDLSDDARATIEKTVNKLDRLASAGKVVRIEGFSSLKGLTTNNMRLSMRRAESVAEYLSLKGCKTDVRITGYGNLKATVGDPAAERRVEISAYDEIFDLKAISNH